MIRIVGLAGASISNVLALPDVPHHSGEIAVLFENENESSDDDLDWIERKYGSDKAGK